MIIQHMELERASILKLYLFIMNMCLHPMRTMMTIRG